MTMTWAKALQRTGTRPWLRRSVSIVCSLVCLATLSVRCRSLSAAVRRRSSYGNITNVAFTRRGLCFRSRHSFQVSYLAVSERRHDFERWQADADRRVCSVHGSMVLHFRNRLHFRLTDLVGCPSHKEKDM